MNFRIILTQFLISPDRNIRYMSYMYHSTTEILRFHSLYPFIFPLRQHSFSFPGVAWKIWQIWFYLRTESIQSCWGLGFTSLLLNSRRNSGTLNRFNSGLASRNPLEYSNQSINFFISLYLIMLNNSRLQFVLTAIKSIYTCKPHD